METDATPRPRLSFPRGARVTRSRDVRRAFDHGRSAASGPVVVYAYRREDAEGPRVAFVVGKRWGGAVRRNRVRRLLREAFRTARPQLPPGHDFLLLPRGPLHGLGMEAVRRRVVNAALRAAERFEREGPGRPRRDDGRRRKRR